MKRVDVLKKRGYYSNRFGKSDRKGKPDQSKSRLNENSTKGIICFEYSVMDIYNLNV